MAKKAKIDNVWKKRFERKEKKRPVNIRDQRVYFLIVCEGEKTEPNYFRVLEKELPIGTVEIKIEGTGLNTIGLLEHALKLIENSSRKHDRVWAVFDKDDFPDNNFNNAIHKGLSHNIKCAWTNEAFELWFLLHFHYVNTPMSRDDYKGYLEREIIKKSGIEDYKYKKNDPDTFFLLRDYGNQQKAINRAKKLMGEHTHGKYAKHNPSTRVHELIQELLDPKEVLKMINDEENSNSR